MDPRHRRILEAFSALRADGKSPAAQIDVAVALGLRDERAMGLFFDEVRQLGWIRPVGRGFVDDTNFELTEAGERELAEAVQRPAPPVTIEDVDDELREFLKYWTYDQPFTAQDLRDRLRIHQLTDGDTGRLLRQMHARGMVRPYGDEGWYPAN